jgi:cytochrome d ubiquinol oxidase subunit II
MTSPSGLQILWFGLIIVLWVGYFLLEGFDFGVGILSPFVGKDDVERRMVLGTIGPFWDGNEVWLLTAGGATFAAFPLWYATLFSGFYLALFIILVALIVRGVGFEFRHQREDARWRTTWDWLLFTGSLVPSVLWGVAFADILQGVPINAHHIYTGTLLDLINPYSLLGGLTSAGLFTLYGATFLCLKLTGPPADRAHTIAHRLSLPVTAVVFAFLAYTLVNAINATDTGIVPGPIPILAVVLVGLTPILIRYHLHGWAFSFAGSSIALVVLTLFLNLYPRVLVSSTSKAFSLTIVQSSSTPYTLTVMTIVAAIFVPVVLVYTGWTYWVFRQRLTRDQFELPRLLQKKPLTPPTPKET